MQHKVWRVDFYHLFYLLFFMILFFMLISLSINFMNRIER